MYPASGNSDYGNTIYNCGIGISHENQTNYHTYDNWIYNTPWAITNIHYSAHGSTADQRSVAANGQIDRNIIYNSQYAFLVIDTNTIKFWNNTANVGSGSSPYAFYVDSTSTYISALDFRNNIIAGSGWTYPIYVPDAASIWSYLDYSDIVPTGTTVLYEASGGAKTVERASDFRALGAKSYNFSGVAVYGGFGDVVFPICNYAARPTPIFAHAFALS